MYDPTDSPRPQAMSRVLPGWDTTSRAAIVVGVLLGEGIGPEIVRAALDVLEAVAEVTGQRFEIRVGGAIGLAAKGESGRELTADVEEFCAAVFAATGAVLCGPGGGRFVYDLRARFDLYCKLTPIAPCAALARAGVLRARLTEGVDIVVVRENRGGIYFGAHDLDVGDGVARHTLAYRRAEVRRILDAAAAIAGGRRRRLAVVVKAGGLPSLTALWRDEAESTCERHAVDLEMLDVDNAAYQLIACPERFDVIAAPNLFGDILSDLGAVLLRSRGMSYSGNFGAGGVAVYQTGHGAAHDLARTDRANPLGQIQSVAMMLRESFGLGAVAGGIVAAIERVLASGIRTADIAATGTTVVGTREMGVHVAEALRRESARARLSA